MLGDDMRFLFPVLAATFLVACSAGVEKAGSAIDYQEPNWWDQLPRAEWAGYQRIASDSPWFEIYQVRPDVYAIYEPGHFEEVISFLIVGSDNALLFDTGMGMSDIKSVVNELTDKPLKVLNSHGHYDHTGGNHQFGTLIGLDNDYARRRSAGMPQSQAGELVTPNTLNPNYSAPGFLAEQYTIKPYTFSSYTVDGAIINLGDRKLQVITTPGHSPDSLSILDRERGQLYVGDTFYKAPLYAHLEGSNVQAYHQSAKKLAALAPNLQDVMTAHNVPMVSPAFLVELRDAFEAISQDTATYKTDGNAREYDFGEFAIITPDQ